MPNEEIAPSVKPVETPAYELVSKEFLQQAIEAIEHDHKDKLLRLRADFDNYRKRMQKEREEAVRYANESLLSDLLPILDNFELGMKAAGTTQNSQDIVHGMSMVLSQFQKLLADVGVQMIDAVGQPFDPYLHEAVGHEVTNQSPEGTVIAQHRKGYKLHHRLLRPASVVVAQASNPS